MAKRQTLLPSLISQRKVNYLYRQRERNGGFYSKLNKDLCQGLLTFYTLFRVRMSIRKQIFHLFLGKQTSLAPNTSNTWPVWFGTKTWQLFLQHLIFFLSRLLEKVAVVLPILDKTLSSSCRFYALLSCKAISKDVYLQALLFTIVFVAA